ncbi:Peptidyl-prolyl cis-trans isomerase, FKBP-type [Metarhizium robertsii ARSEF 23]|uniref:peptidylprolyl isomerase n=1 Tax=Metarhizium robertsii (strain ARSEF 23 / ATCC MYA-3075) TaxID=655844 RepID=E9EL94_METRA|nr:Peptidyl-prolyl cis-trans isomerase, FKBP-type [Metarhizium robertsii ARSEF 23]EFZ03488.2 Peptidyl-prolyl cis-trans isomerase, FKBP-type [Metarhizium robertsii ARSEF 23]
MKSITFLSVLAASAVGLGAADDLKIDVTHSVQCDRKTQKGDKVAMHYKGTLGDSGKKFDASYDRGQPLQFTLGAGQVIAGFDALMSPVLWDKGLLDMCIGEKRTLTIPSELAYGDRGIGPIPPGATLIFETELVGIDGVAPPEKETGKDEAKENKEADKAGEKVIIVVLKATEAPKTFMADNR